MTPTQRKILELLKQVNAGLWQQVDQVPEGGMLLPLADASNRGLMPEPVPCSRQDLTALQFQGYILPNAPGSSNSYMISASGKSI